NSGLLLYLLRAYDPNLQRWLNRDPIAELGGPNLYVYVNNNPINLADFDGMIPGWDALSNAAQTTGNALWSAAQTVGNAVWGEVQDTGHALQTVGNAVWGGRAEHWAGAFRSRERYLF